MASPFKWKFSISLKKLITPSSNNHTCVSANPLLIDSTIHPQTKNQQTGRKRQRKKQQWGKKKTKIKTWRVVCWAGKIQETSTGELLKIVRDLGDSSYRSNELSQAACSTHNASRMHLAAAASQRESNSTELVLTSKKSYRIHTPSPRGLGRCYK